jgi:hypothetical protein
MNFYYLLTRLLEGLREWRVVKIVILLGPRPDFLLFARSGLYVLVRTGTRLYRYPVSIVILFLYRVFFSWIRL